MTRRQSGWKARALPGIRNRLVESLCREAGRLRDLKDEAVRLGRAGDANVFDRNARTHWDMTRTVEESTLIWVSGPMMRVALDSSQDVPALNDTDCPAECGLLVFQDPLPAVDTTTWGGLDLRDGQRTDVAYTDPVAVDAIAWHLHGGHLDVSLMCRPSRLPLPLFPDQSPDLVPYAGLACEIPAVFDGVQAVNRDGEFLDHATLGPLAFLSAAWVLMMTPSAASRTRIDVGTGRPATASTPMPAVVTVVDLRPLRHAQVEDPEDTGRHLTRQHVVRGHWTHQPYGKGREYRRVQWIDSYIRGPEGAPLDERTLVYQWRR